jgi:hypothetical protein
MNSDNVSTGACPTGFVTLNECSQPCAEDCMVHEQAPSNIQSQVNQGPEMR